MYFKYSSLEMTVNYFNWCLPWKQGQMESQEALAWSEAQHKLDNRMQ